jgi:hypothetical protein
MLGVAFLILLLNVIPNAENHYAERVIHYADHHYAESLTTTYASP